VSIIRNTANRFDNLDEFDKKLTARREQLQVWQKRYRRAVIAGDLLAGALVALIAYYVRFGGEEDLPFGYVICTALMPFLWVVLLDLVRAHEPRFLFVGTEEFRRIVLAGGVLTIAIALISYAGKIEVARGWVLLTVVPITLGTLVLRFAWRKRLHRRRETHGDCMHRVVVVGYERASANLFRTLQLDPYHGFDVVGVCLPPDRMAAAGDTLADCDLPVLGSFDNVAMAVAEAGADTVVVLACPELDGPAMRRLAWDLEATDTELLVAPVLLEVAGPRVTVRPVADLPLMHVEHTELTHWRRWLKSAFDRVGAGLVLFLVSPVLLAVAAGIKLTSRGPVLFRQTRIGHRGEPFQMLKFRSMVVDAESQLSALREQNNGAGVLFKLREDPRVTRIGRFIRRYSLDELPQLVNVLRGQMSLVGPRPPLPSEVATYEQDVHRRFAVRPGITGLWQVSGRSDLPWDESVRLDIRYVERWSLLLDILIICRTAGAVLRKTGAY
jgi:exopolysaccharide biosynthesis polyprenyl glycosylphosphotransferase